MTGEFAIVISAAIGAVAATISSVLTFFTNRKLSQVHKEVNGMKTELVESTRLYGEAVGNRAGREELAREISGKPPQLILLDDEEDDLHLIERIVIKMSIENYLAYSDEEVFLKNLTTDANMYVVDNKLKKRNGLNISHEILAKNENSVIMICTGAEQDIASIYINSGVNFFVFKNDKNFEQEFERYVRGGLRKVALRK